MVLESDRTTACLRNAAGATAMGAAEDVYVCEAEEPVQVAPPAEVEGVKTFPQLRQTGQRIPLTWSLPPDPHISENCMTGTE